MLVGVAKETKPAERRVALSPAGAHELVATGQDVVVERGAGEGSGFADLAYAEVGARVGDRDEVWATSELLLKVKEPIEHEYELLRPRMTLFAYLHLAAELDLTAALVEADVTAIAYETVEDRDGRLSLLAPMSAIAGRLAAQAGAYFLQAPLGGAGVLMGGAPGVSPARVVIVGGGAVGTHAARVAAGMGAATTILERSSARIRELDEQFDGRVQVLMSDPLTVSQEVPGADLVIGAVLIPGARAPRVVTRKMLREMRTGTVIVDVAIDQGGCVETSRPTTYDDPVFVVDGVLHYCVSNMPGAVPATATRALTNATLPYVRKLATLGIDQALSEDPGLAKGLNVRGGRILNAEVARAQTAPRYKTA